MVNINQDRYLYMWIKVNLSARESFFLSQCGFVGGMYVVLASIANADELTKSASSKSNYARSLHGKVTDLDSARSYWKANGRAKVAEENAELAKEKANHLRSNCIFSKQYQSVIDPISRVVSIVTAPIILSIYAIEQFLEFILYGLSSLEHYMAPNFLTTLTQQSVVDYNLSIAALTNMFVLLSAAIASPIINSIDLIGGGLSSVIGFENSPVFNASTLP